MVKSSKTQRLRERMRADIKHSRQTTLSNPPEEHKKDSAKAVTPEQLKKEIIISEISTSAREDELAFKVGFRLLPSRTAFSRVTSDLYFDEQKIDSLRLRILQGPLATNDYEFSSVLDMTGIGEGQHILRVEMYEVWSSGEKLASTSREATVEYVPLKKEDRLSESPNCQEHGRRRFSDCFRLRENHLPRVRRKHEERFNQQTRQMVESAENKRV